MKEYAFGIDLGGTTACPDTVCSNLHEGDLVAYNTKTDSICTLEDLHAEQKEFPHCIADGIFVLNEDVKPGDDAILLGQSETCEVTPDSLSADTEYGVNGWTTCQITARVPRIYVYNGQVVETRMLFC